MAGGNYLAILDKQEASKYYGKILGLRQYTKDANKYVVDDNYTNRLVLGHSITRPKKFLSLKDDNGLLPFQVEDVLRMTNVRGFLNANRMGTGKTIETVMACKNLDAKSILIVCPKSVIGQWVAKFKTWWPERADDIVVYAIGDEVVRNKIYVLNYEKLIHKKSAGKFNSFVWNVLAVDEAHYIKNRTAQRTKACKSITAQYRYALTGTPITKTPNDLYSILDFLNPLYAGRSYWNFVRYYCEVVNTYFEEEIRGLTKNPERVKLLNDLLAEIYCRRSNEHIAKGKQAIDVPLIMDKAQQALYNKIRKLLLDQLPQTLSIPNGAVLLTRLIQATSAPQLIDPENKQVYPGVKFEWVYEQLMGNPDEKFVVFSRFAEITKALSEFLKSKGIGCTTYIGSMNDQQRENSKRQFITDPTCRVIAGTIGALGTGVDELQEACHICVFIDRDFSPEINQQCEDRLHRMGQQKSVLCYYLECNSTVDNKISKVNLERAEDIRKALND